MSRPLSILSLVLICGCGAPTSAVQVPAPPGERALDKPKESAFRYETAKRVIFLDSRVAPPEKRHFALGQGSIKIETLRVKDGKLTFRYTPEVEGGWTTYECSVPVSDKPVEFKIEPSGVPGATSFGLSGCKVVGRGSLLDK